jgi:hypothetical protein
MYAFEYGFIDFSQLLHIQGAVVCPQCMVVMCTICEGTSCGWSLASNKGSFAGLLQVMDSWRAILSRVRPRAFKIKLEEVRVYANESSGFVTCVEVVDSDDREGR